MERAFSSLLEICLLDLRTLNESPSSAVSGNEGAVCDMGGPVSVCPFFTRA